ncbi:MAG: aminotransferase class IV [Anaerolineales bacterium]
MKILAYQLHPGGPQPLTLQAESLDAATAQLPGGLYTTFRTFDNGRRVLGLNAHLKRLYKTKIPTLTPEELKKSLAELLDSGEAGEWRARLILAESAPTGACFALLERFSPPPASLYQNGVRAETVLLARATPRLKTTAFIAASAEARKRLGGGIYEIIMLRPDGGALEGLTSNFYLLRGQTLFTAREGILPGITRRAVLHLARQLGLKISYQPPRLDQPFDEALLSSSSRGIVPIVEIDGKAVGGGQPGPIARRLNAAYDAYVLRNAAPLKK